MKLLTVAVPCYNSEAYMSHCLDTLLSAGDEIEIIIVNDGSKDNTGAIADRYQAEHPDIIRVIHQENGGHGEGVNQGIRNATGLYFKVVDSDDWVNEEAFLKLLARIRSMVESGNMIDMYVANYVYEHVEDGTQYTMRYKSRFPLEEVCTWNEVRAFGVAQILMMHSFDREGEKRNLFFRCSTGNTIKSYPFILCQFFKKIIPYLIVILQ